MVIATWNVNSVRARLEHLLRYLPKRGPDVLCLQELKVQEPDFPAEPLAELGYRAAVAGQKTYNGVAVLTRAPAGDPVVGFPHLPPDHPLNEQRRLLAVTVAGVRVVSAYLPNGEAVGSDKYAYKLAFFAELRRYLAAEVVARPHLVLAGDFNVAPEDRDLYDPEGWAGGVLCSPPERAALEAIRALGLVDCLRRHCPEAGVYTWWDYRGGAYWKNQGLRIDHLWATSALAAACTAAGVDRSPRQWTKPSDHAPLWAEFAVPPPVEEAP